MQIKLTHVVVATFLAVYVSDLLVRFNSFIGESNGSTVVILLLNLGSLIGLLTVAAKSSWKDGAPKYGRLLITLLFVWNGITLLRGLLSASDYWAWKTIATSHVFMLTTPFAIAIGLSLKRVRPVVWTSLLFVLPVSLALIPLTLSYDTELYARAVLPASVLLLMMPFIRARWWPLILASSVISLTLDVSYRANAVRIAVGLLLFAAYYARTAIRPAALNAIVGAAFLLPVVFLYLGSSDRFNVFRDGVTLDASVQVVEGGQIRDSGLSADTRTFLYREVTESMARRGSSMLWGEGAGAGYDTEYFRDFVVGAGGRSGSEVGFLNSLLFSGAIGVLLYAGVLAYASMLAINKSRNFLCRALGLYLAYRWLIFFIEDIPRFDLNFLLLWVVVGLCLSKEVRSLNDAEIFGSLSNGQRKNA